MSLCLNLFVSFFNSTPTSLKINDDDDDDVVVVVVVVVVFSELS